MAKSGFKGVSRIDQPSKNNHGWYVRVSFNGKQHSKFFNDFKHGGKDAALTAAVAYRDATERELGKPRTDRQVASKTSRNSSGIVGVRRRTRHSKAGAATGELKEYYEVSWTPWPGKVRRKLFSINDMGERSAFLAACAFRRKMEREHFGEEIRGNWINSLATILQT
jgi:hypothetical protein